MKHLLTGKLGTVTIVMLSCVQDGPTYVVTLPWGEGKDAQGAGVCKMKPYVAVEVLQNCHGFSPSHV